ncbi:MAG: class I SAM-dependent methyltransferase, partial [Candidatus Omnitrophica bacterium]|nr:class I SAM-dependent methyltransferase [Candidatus Omnitrophota bacterium]
MQGAYYKRTGCLLKADPSKPKHYFKVVGDKIQDFIKNRKGWSLLDVGGATGAFASYIRHRFGDIDITVLDCDEVLVREGRARIKECRFVLGDVRSMCLDDQRFDVTTCMGTIGFFDRFDKVIDELLRVTKKGGMVAIFTRVNDYPVDCLIRYRYSEDEKRLWHTGYNTFSRYSYEQYFRENKDVASSS